MRSRRSETGEADAVGGGRAIDKSINSDDPEQS